MMLEKKLVIILFIIKQIQLGPAEQEPSDNLPVHSHSFISNIRKNSEPSSSLENHGSSINKGDRGGSFLQKVAYLPIENLQGDSYEGFIGELEKLEGDSEASLFEEREEFQDREEETLEYGDEGQLSDTEEEREYEEQAYEEQKEEGEAFLDETEEETEGEEEKEMEGEAEGEMEGEEEEEEEEEMEGEEEEEMEGEKGDVFLDLRFAPPKDFAVQAREPESMTLREHSFIELTSPQTQPPAATTQPGLVLSNQEQQAVVKLREALSMVEEEGFQKGLQKGKLEALHDAEQKKEAALQLGAGLTPEVNSLCLLLSVMTAIMLGY